jgi:glycosyltransferase involved in cell wall biosynthesis
VRCIGQAIPDEQFTFNNILREKKKFLVYGRLDESKRVHDIIELCKQKRTSVRDLTLTIIGSPSNQANQIWARNLKMLYNKDIELGWLEFHESVPREMAGFIFPKFDALIHSFQGSLDKVLVEAIFSGIPVVTINLPFVKEFGRWSQTNGLVLEQELDAFFSLPPAHILKYLDKELNIFAVRNLQIRLVYSIGKLCSTFNTKGR